MSLAALTAGLVLGVLPFSLGLAAGHRRRGWPQVGALLIGVVVVGALDRVALAQGAFAATVSTALLSAPLMVGGLAWGTWSHRAGRWGGPTAVVVMLAAAALSLAGARPPPSRAETVKTWVQVSAPPESAWAALKGFGALSGARPLLMRLGLPTPLRCTLEADSVGARRVCHFDQGRIEQRVERWEPPRRLGLAIVETDLPLKLFTFTAAEYTLTAVGGGTRVERTSTFTSQLLPAWLWRPLERLTVEAEHRYLLDDLGRRWPPALSPSQP